MKQLQSRKVVVIGGDARQLEVIGALVEWGAVVQLAGFDRIEEPIRGTALIKLEPSAFAQADAIILPVAGTDDEGRAESVFSAGELIVTSDMIASLPKHGLVITGIAKGSLRARCKEYGISLIEMLDRDDVAIYNSIPTAEGAVMVAIQHTDFTIHGSNCMVLGLGRIGLTLAQTLAGLGAKVKAGVRRPDEFARAAALGLQPFYTTGLADEIGDADIVFNTVPAVLITADIISRISRHALIVDLASRPGGTDFRAAEEQGVKAIHALGLPGIVAPKTAGKIMARTIIELLTDAVTIGNT